MQSGGTITDAVSTQKWPGDAKVHVSLVNWIKAPSAGPATLNGLQVEGIDSSLRPSSMDDWRPRVLLHNRLRCFQGPIPVGAGFVLGDVEARQLLDIVDRDYRDVVRPYLTANDIAEDPRQAASRWIIDFGQRPLEEARRYSTALDLVRERVRPFRETVNREGHRTRWWQFGEPRVSMRSAIAGLDHYATIAAHAKRATIAWTEPWTLPSNACMVFRLCRGLLDGCTSVPCACGLGVGAVVDVEG